MSTQMEHPDTLRPGQRARRDRIVLAALELLEEGEYDAIHVRDVAERADVALGTMYHYFSSKEHLYAAAMLDWASSFRNTIARRPLSGQTSQDRLKDLFGRVIRAFERRPQFLRLEIVLENSTDPHAREMFSVFSDHNQSTFATALDTLPLSEARAVTGIAAIVMGSMLHAWALERVEITRVYETVFQAIDLIFSPPPGAVRTH
jgi:AcrR family transcriptional regulator